MTEITTIPSQAMFICYVDSKFIINDRSKIIFSGLLIIRDKCFFDDGFLFISEICAETGTCCSTRCYRMIFLLI